MFSKLAPFTFGILVVTNGRAVPAAPVSAAQDVRELLVAARGVAPSLCTLAADGVYSWGGRWTAPAEPVRSDIRSRVRRLHRRHLAADESRALLEGIASTDACERHLSATLIGRFGDSAIVRDLSTRLGAGAAPERQATLVALGLLEAKSQLQPIIHALRDEAPAVRANAAWALGLLEQREATPALVGALKDVDESVRGAAVAALRRLRSADSIETLL